MHTECAFSTEDPGLLLFEKLANVFEMPQKKVNQTPSLCRPTDILVLSKKFRKYSYYYLNCLEPLV